MSLPKGKEGVGPQLHTFKTVCTCQTLRNVMQCTGETQY